MGKSVPSRDVMAATSGILIDGQPTYVDNVSEYFGPTFPVFALITYQR
ncbi:MAG: hypothetical protein U0401_27875 [Anaerolineae bacterium]